MLKENRYLFDLGFAVHLLREKSKAPLRDGWTKGPRLSREELGAEFKLNPNSNVGVRLGKVSAISNRGFLAVIDCDVKGEDPRFKKEMELKLFELFPELKGPVPCVISGRGNGSRHIYVVVKTPVKGKKLAHSSEKVKVKIGSKPSKDDIEALSPQELEQGLRLRDAWEIGFMCEGQQVVLPPSIHPNTGKVYEWLNAPMLEDDFPLINIEGVEADTKKTVASVVNFEPIEVDISVLDQATQDQIRYGEGVADRSNAAFFAAGAMLRAGFSEQAVLSVLTNREYHLGNVGYDHSKSDRLDRAATWVKKYCLEKAREQFSPQIDFAVPYEEGQELSEADTEAQFDDIIASVHWSTLLERNDIRYGGKPKNTLKNAVLIFENICGEESDIPLVKRNIFASRDRFVIDTPWGSKTGDEVSDRDVTNLRVFVSQRYGVELSKDRAFEALSNIAARHSVHPVRDYLNGLVWDGKPRVDSWLKTYMGAEEHAEYLSQVGRKILCALVARAFVPGIKFDYVAILEGEQGTRKSSTLAALVGPEWFTDQEINIHDKDAILTIQGKWLVEMGEISAMKKADVDSLKAFITRGVDRIREPYGRAMADFPRQNVFLGSTNNEDYLNDPTGNRRFWPVKIHKCDPEGVARDRDQLFAEAMVLWKAGEKLYIEDEDLQLVEKEIQASRHVEDSLVEQLRSFFDSIEAKKEADRELDLSGFLMSDFAKPFSPFANLCNSMADQKRMGRALRKIGIEPIGTHHKGKRGNFWGVKKRQK